jgi:hypothetical protein
MRSGVEYRGPIKVRGYELLVRPLSLAETIKVVGNVSARLRDVPAAARSALHEHTILAMETLVLASTSDVGANDPQITEMVIERMTPEEVQNLFVQYVKIVDRANPALEMLTPEQVNELLEHVKKNLTTPSELAFRLTELSFSELASIAHMFLTKSE